jgi:hypothetical protein
LTGWGAGTGSLVNASRGASRSRKSCPRRITDGAVEGLIVKTLESNPRDASPWSIADDGE